MHVHNHTEGVYESTLVGYCYLLTNFLVASFHALFITDFMTSGTLLNSYLVSGSVSSRMAVISHKIGLLLATAVLLLFYICILVTIFMLKSIFSVSLIPYKCLDLID